MIQKKVYSISILELILTALILTLAVILQEASWLNNLTLPSPRSAFYAHLERLSQIYE